jgi:hypothetical protein
VARAQSRKCSRTTASGEPCQAWAVHGSDPPVCAAHARSGRAVLDARPDAAREPAATPDILDVIADLAAKQLCLSRYIDECLAAGDTAVPDLTRLLALHSQNAARLGRLFRDKQALLPDADDERTAAIFQALDELSEEWGVEL